MPTPNSGAGTSTGDLNGARVRDRLVGAVLLGADRRVIAAALARHAPNLPVQVMDSGDDGAMMKVVVAELARPGAVPIRRPGE